MKPASGTWLVQVAMAWAVLAAAGTWSIRMACADYQIRQETPGGTERAMALMPGQSEYYARLAWLVSGDDPRKAETALRRAVALNSWDARSWIELGLLAEAREDDVAAQQCLLRAAEVDRQFLPRWTLANYYFRRGNVNMFWHWTREAAAMLYGDARPVFRLCARVAEDGNLIDRLQIRNPEVRAAYLAYLLEQNRVDLIGPALQRLVEENREDDVPLLLTACDRLLDARRVDEAAGVWNRQAAAGRLPFPTPAGAGEQFIVNGSFLAPPASRGFDWRLPAVEGISASREERPPGLRITFSGREPEDCEALAQLVPLRMRTAYDLSFGYRTREIPRGVGLGWRITDASSGAILKEGPSLASESEGEGRLSFETPGECSLVRLALRYRRTPGTTRLEGYLVLRNLELKPSAQLPIEGSRVRK